MDNKEGWGMGGPGRLGFTRIYCRHLVCNRSLGFPGGSVARNLPAVQEARVQSLGGEDPLETRMGTCSRILTGESHTEACGGLQSMGSQSRTRLSDQA